MVRLSRWVGGGFPKPLLTQACIAGGESFLNPVRVGPVVFALHPCSYMLGAHTGEAICSQSLGYPAHQSPRQYSSSQHFRSAISPESPVKAQCGRKPERWHCGSSTWHGKLIRKSATKSSGGQMACLDGVQLCCVRDPESGPQHAEGSFSAMISLLHSLSSKNNVLPGSLPPK